MKGLDVLIGVNDLAPVTVASLVGITGLPKPTLIRILNTLVSEGYVVKRNKQEGGGYFPTPKVRLLSSVFAHGSMLSQIAQPHINNLCEIVKWPSDLLVRDGLSMLIETSNRHISPISLKKFEQKRFPILSTGSGRAFLAWLPKTERKEIITASLATMSEPVPDIYSSIEKVERYFDEIRVRGYEIRNYDTPIEGTRLYCLPIMVQGHPIAILSLITLRDVISVENFEKQVLPYLQATAYDIASQFNRHSNRARHN